MSFYQRLVKETEVYRAALYGVPQLADALQGRIDRETYAAYLAQAYHHVRHTVPLLMSMGTNLPDEKNWMHKSIVEYLEEEIGHEEWILNDIAACGGDREAVRKSAPQIATQAMVAYNYDYIARKNPVGFFGMVFMLESTSTEIASKGADSVKKALNLPNNAFTYLYSHGSLDIKHMAFFEETMNGITDPDDQAAIIEVAQNAFQLFAGIFRALPQSKRETRHAA
ncbi:MAG: iron-containing redox enzyme family protein [Rhodospirillales bacterium]|nr:iron-containing redox enzyme family protein [Alphaproteobacteria bacterium]MCB9986378.1 iron-containing redox enzyme family protein [Rhodospirillales bacterium]USO07073.1 MAG: iron-containing redox enzyme family protein [Rhodospirillales bacterium]